MVVVQEPRENEIRGVLPSYQVNPVNYDVMVTACPHQVGDLVNVTCYSRGSSPPAELQWTVNGERVRQHSNHFYLLSHILLWLGLWRGGYTGCTPPAGPDPPWPLGPVPATTRCRWPGDSPAVWLHQDLARAAPQPPPGEADHDDVPIPCDHDNVYPTQVTSASNLQVHASDLHHSQGLRLQCTAVIGQHRVFIC